jgi:glycosyltransferase involved in cell wall biosynthesis
MATVLNKSDEKRVESARPAFVVITPARNEAEFIGKTVESVIAQTVKPLRWVIVDDGSTDATAEIASKSAADHPWIEVVRMPPRKERHFAGKVHAFNAGLERVSHLQFAIVANLDADVSLEPDHFEFLLSRFAEDPKLGVAGTVYTQPDWDSMTDSFEGEECVAGPLQFFRSDCFQDIGGYVPNRFGGIDWIAVTRARMKGWTTKCFPQRRFRHHRTMGSAGRGIVRTMMFMGRKDYLLGSSPIWYPFRVAYRMTKPPYVIGGLSLLAGYTWAAIQRLEQPGGADMVRFYRAEQMRKLKRILRSLITGRRPEKFYVEPDAAGQEKGTP